MRRIGSTILSCLLTSFVAYSQVISLEKYYLHAGIGFPSSPDRFVDYWNPGPTLGGGLGFKMTSSMSIDLIVDYARFTVDEESFFKRIQVSGKSNSVSGGATNILATSILFRFFPAESQTIPIFLFGGGSLSFAVIDQVTATYSGYSVDQGSETHFGASLVLGAGFLYPISQTTDVFVQGRVSFGLTEDAQANTHFSPITAGMRVSI